LPPQQGLAAAKAKGVKSGRPKGRRNKTRRLDPYQKQIRDYLQMGLNLAAVRKLINNQLDKPPTYNTYKYFVENEDDLLQAWRDQRMGNS